MSSKNCTSDLCILVIVLLALKYRFNKADLYLRMKQKESNSVSKTFWFSNILMSASLHAKYLILLLPHQYF